MIQIHKLVLCYSTMAMLFIGGSYLYDPNFMMDAFGVLPNKSRLEELDAPLQMAYNLAFGSHLVVAVLGMYAIWNNHSPLHTNIALLAISTHQSLFAWATQSMPDQWKQVHLLPVQVNVLLSTMLWIIPEPKPELPSLKRRGRIIEKTPRTNRKLKKIPLMAPKVKET